MLKAPKASVYKNEKKRYARVEYLVEGLTNKKNKGKTSKAGTTAEDLNKNIT